MGTDKLILKAVWETVGPKLSLKKNKREGFALTDIKIKL